MKKIGKKFFYGLAFCSIKAEEKREIGGDSEKRPQ